MVILVSLTSFFKAINCKFVVGRIQVQVDRIQVRVDHNQVRVDHNQVEVNHIVLKVIRISLQLDQDKQMHLVIHIEVQDQNLVKCLTTDMDLDQEAHHDDVHGQLQQFMLIS